MVFDCHVHMGEGNPEELTPRMKKAGVSGCILISDHPNWFVYEGPTRTHVQRLDALFEFTRGATNVIPFYWIDPIEPDAMEQVALAKSYGIKGFKVICSSHFPADERAVPVYTRIASEGFPIMFHSGILFDSHDSSQYNYPTKFERLFDIEGLRFSMAHISWPWCDEMIAVFGKFRSGRRKNKSLELFIDLCPGTPPMYREDAITKLLNVGYQCEDNMIFGTDCNSNYSYGYSGGILKQDNEIYAKLGTPQEIQDKIYYKNVLRFLGMDKFDFE